MKVKKRHKKNYSRKKKKTSVNSSGYSKPAKISSNHIHDLILSPKQESNKTKNVNPLSDSFTHTLTGKKYSGSPLPNHTKIIMESHFGENLSNVKIHTDSESAGMNSQLDSKAFTVGKDIYFGKNNFKPDTSEGKKLIAHEITHVLQNRNPSIIHKAPENDKTVLIDYKVKSGDNLTKISQKFETTVAKIKEDNGLKSDDIKVGQMLKVTKPSTCDIARPSNGDTQLLTGAIFAEAEARTEDNEERLCIGWAFKNSVQHVSDLKSGTICGDLTKSQRAYMVKKDTRDLGDSLESAIKIGSAAYGNSRWNKVMSGNSMLPLGNLCLLDALETSALKKAIHAATDVAAGNNKKADIVRFNQANNSPPSTRMEKASRVGAHTFYKFSEGKVCGEWK